MNSSSPSFPQTMKMVVAPASDHPEGIDLNSLVLFLQDKLNISIDLYRCSNYEEAINNLTDGSAQLGWLGSLAYKEAVAKDNSIEAFAVGVRKGRSTPNYNSLFIVRPDSEIKNLVDVRNTSLALSDIHSTSGYSVPKHELSELGIDIDNDAMFKKIIRVDNHDKAIRAVLNGLVDVAPVSSVNLEEMVTSGAINSTSFRIIYQSPDILGAPLVFSSSIDQSLKKKLKELVLDAHNHIKIGGYGGRMNRYVDPEESRINLLESYLQPQWGWSTFAAIAIFFAVYTFIWIDLKVDPTQIIENSVFYLGDILVRMMPPDFSNFSSLIMSMIETIEIAMLGTLLAIILSVPIGLLSARNIAPNYPIYVIARTITIFFRKQYLNS